MFKFILDKIVWGFAPICLTLWIFYFISGYKVGTHNLGDLEFCILGQNKECIWLPPLGHAHLGYIPNEMTLKLATLLVSALLIQFSLIWLIRYYLNSRSKITQDAPITYWQI